MADDGDRNKTPTTMTTPHKRLMSLLRTMGFHPIEELQVGKYSIDCYVDEVHCGFECDGKRFHAGVAKGKKDKARDAWIFENAGIPLLRIHADTIMQVKMWDTLKEMVKDHIERFSPTLDERLEKGKAFGVI